MIKGELVDYANWRSFAEDCQQLQRWLEVEYNFYHIHSALDYATLAEIGSLDISGAGARNGPISSLFSG